MIRFFLLVVLISSYSYSQTFEQDVINAYKKDTLNYDFIATLSAIDSSVTSTEVDKYKSQIENFIRTLPPHEEKSKREKKRIEKIYNLTHDRFFEKYEELAYFPQIFNNGIYNCVTATALYTHIFSKLDIPFAIKDEPGHVYLIAYPETHKIILETTAPGIYGFRAPKDSEVREQVNQLVELKLVTPEEVRANGESQIFILF